MTVGFYLLQRLFYSVPLVLGAVTIVFVLVHLAPGNPVDYLVGDTGADKEMIARLTAELGLDQPLYIQLARYLGQVVRGNLGFSFASNAPVLDLILDRLPATLLLMASQLVFSVSLGIGLGVLSARRANGPLDNTITVFSLASFAIPVFWLGQLLILAFGYYLDWLPIQGMFDLRAGYSGFDLVLDVARHMILPVLTLTLYNLALVLRLTRGSLLEAVNQEYVKVARSKGLSENTVMIKHALPALIASLDATLKRANNGTSDVQAELIPVLRDAKAAAANLRETTETLRRYPASMLLGAPPPRANGASQ